MWLAREVERDAVPARRRVARSGEQLKHIAPLQFVLCEVRGSELLCVLAFGLGQVRLHRVGAEQTSLRVEDAPFKHHRWVP